VDSESNEPSIKVLTRNHFQLSAGSDDVTGSTGVRSTACCSTSYAPTQARVTW